MYMVSVCVCARFSGGEVGTYADKYHQRDISAELYESGFVGTYTGYIWFYWNFVEKQVFYVGFHIFFKLEFLTKSCTIDQSGAWA